MALRFLNNFKKKNVISFVTFVFLVIFLSSIIPPLKNTLLDILKYPLNLLTLIRRQATGIIFYHRNMIQSENLKREIDLLRRKLNETNEIYLENKRMRKLLSFKQKSSYKVIVARVIGRAPDNWSSVIIINKGKYNGIKPGMIAITCLGLIGRLVETTEYTSQIMLINDLNLGVSCVVGRSRQEGLVSGSLGNFLIMKYLPKDADVKVSDIVVTSGLTDAYPKGLLVGSVIEVGEELSGLMRYCLIKPAVNLSSIEEVLIIIP